MLTAQLKPRPRLKATVTRPYQGKGYAEGFNAGKQAEYDAFWDAYQNKGQRVIYSRAFSGEGWTDTTFKPKYDIICEQWTNYAFTNALITDIKGALDAQGVRLDVSQVSGLTYFFQNCPTVRVPALDCSSATSCLGVFFGCNNLKEIELNNVREELTGSNAFGNCFALTTLKITGTVGTSFLKLNTSPLLSNESVQNIIDHLKDLTGQTAQTLTLHATVGAKLTDAQKSAITAKNWTLVY